MYKCLNRKVPESLVTENNVATSLWGLFIGG